ncbi:MAG: hypothetical protein ACR2PL_20225 [Dehalococcoidia bacterium]
MPTFEITPRFRSEYAHLRPDQREAFRRARQEFIRVLSAWEESGRSGLLQFPAGLGVKPMVNQRNIMELAWAPDGRCTWHYGIPELTGKRHIIWRRIGSHAIYDDP